MNCLLIAVGTNGKVFILLAFKRTVKAQSLSDPLQDFIKLFHKIIFPRFY